MINLVINDFVKDAAYGSFGEQAPLKRSLNWITDVVSYDSGKEQRNQIRASPIRTWWINWQWMDEAARDKLVELFHRARGRHLSFLYRDYYDQLCTYTDWSSTAVGGETTTQLGKTYYNGETEEWTENKTVIQPSAKYAPTIKIDAAAKTEGTHFTLDDVTGIINWAGGSSPNGALGAGEVVTANFKYYFKVRFMFDGYIDIEHQINWFTSDELVLIEDLS